MSWLQDLQRGAFASFYAFSLILPLHLRGRDGQMIFAWPTTPKTLPFSFLRLPIASDSKKFKVLFKKPHLQLFILIMRSVPLHSSCHFYGLIKMYSRHGYLSNSPYHSQDLQRYSNIKSVCHCLRGTTKLANCFGPWDHLAEEIPPGNANSRHVSDGKFLLSDLKQHAVPHRKTLPSLVKCPKRGSTVSLGYLSRSCAAKEELCKFRHFVTVAEHIRHYRQNKPNSLYEPAEQESAAQAGDAEELDEM